MPNNLEEQIGKQASNMSRNRVIRRERIVYEIQDGTLVEEVAETIIGEDGIETIETTQSTLGECGHVITRENVAYCRLGHAMCSACASQCGKESCENIPCCYTCSQYSKAKRFFPWL